MTFMRLSLLRKSGYQKQATGTPIRRERFFQGGELRCHGCLRSVLLPWKLLEPPLPSDPERHAVQRPEGVNQRRDGHDLPALPLVAPSRANCANRLGVRHPLACRPNLPWLLRT